jgi:DNA-binding beta-propeller fold protein YncE
VRVSVLPFRKILMFAASMSLVSVSAGIATAATPGAKLWSTDYNGPSNGDDRARSVVISPDGTKVFATGSSDGGGTTGFDVATVAYDPATGDELWAKRYNGPIDSDDAGTAVAVSPDGAKVFVTGYSDGGYPSPFFDYITLAYDASTGAKLWARRYDGPASGRDDAASVAVSPDGAAIFVTGESASSTSGDDYATIAYDASTGAKLWVGRYNGPGDLGDYAYVVVVSPDGTKVVVTGQSSGAVNPDMATVAYDAATGFELWVKRYKGPDNRFDDGDAVAVSPDSTMIFVTGGSSSYTSGYDYATIAYDASNGTKQWARRYDGPSSSDDAARALAVSADGTQIFVTGVSVSATYSDYATVAYGATDGAQMWAKRYGGPGDAQDFAHAIAVSPDGTRVYVTGESVGSSLRYDYATISYDASAGGKLWTRRYNGGGTGDDYARSLAVSSDGAALFVTGEALGVSSGYDYVTIAYSV